VVGLDDTAAKGLIENNGLVANELQQPDDNIPKGKVISQTPDPNSMVDAGSVVTITVSTGKNQVALPDVTGQSQQTAVNSLSQAGFKPIVRLQSSDTVPAGKVITTSPAPNTQVPPDASIIVVVSSGPPPTTLAPTTTAAPTTTQPATTTTTAKASTTTSSASSSTTTTALP
jgi:serine/threonine-protein kinase